MCISIACDYRLYEAGLEDFFNKRINNNYAYRHPDFLHELQDLKRHVNIISENDLFKDGSRPSSELQSAAISAPPSAINTVARW